MPDINPLTGLPYKNAEPQKTAPINPLTGQPYKTDFSSPENQHYNTSLGTQEKVDPSQWKDYSRLTDHPFIGDESMYAKMAAGQTTGEQFGNMIKGGSKLFTAGVIDGLTQWDLGAAYDMMSGNVKDYNDNFFHTIAEDFRASAQENNPIYENDPGSVSPSDPAWWMNQGQQVAYSMGLAAEAFGEMAIGTGAIKGLGVALKGTELLRAAQSMGKVTETLSTSQKYLLKQGMFGFAKGVQEGYLNGIQTYTEAYQHYTTDLRMGEDEAKRLASIAASEAFRKEAIVGGVIKGLEYATLGYNPVSGETTSIFDGIKNRAARVATKAGVEIGGEAFEEGWQNVVSNEGKYVADRMAGLTSKSTFGDRMKDYTSDSRIWNEMIGGALGGGAFATMSLIRNKAAKLLNFAPSVDANQVAYNNFKEKRQAMSLDYTNSIAEQRDLGNLNNVTALQRQYAENLALTGYHLDNINGNTKNGAYNDHVTFLQTVLDAANTNDGETLAQFGYTTEEHKEQIKNSYPEYIADANQIKSIYDNEKRNNFREAIMPIVSREFQKSKFQEDLSRYESELSSERNNFKDYNDLTEIGRMIYDSQTSIESLKSFLLAPNVGEENTSRYNNLISIQQSYIDAASRNEQGVRTTEEYDNDESILNSITRNNKYTSTKVKITKTKEALNTIRKELKTWRDPKFQNNLEKNNLIKNIVQAKTEEELDAIESGLSEDEKNLPEIKTGINKVRNVIRAVQNSNSNTEVTVQQEPIPVVAENPVENTNTVQPTDTAPADRIPVVVQLPTDHLNNDLGPTTNAKILAMLASIQATQSTDILIGDYMDNFIVDDDDTVHSTPSRSSNSEKAKNDFAKLLKGIATDLKIDFPTLDQVIKTISKRYAITPINRAVIENSYSEFINDVINDAMDSYMDYANQQEAPTNKLGNMSAEDIVQANQSILSDLGDDTINEDKKPIYTSFKINTPDLKLAYLNLTYAQGAFGKNTNDLNNLRSGSILDFNKFKVGTNLKVVPNPNGMVTQWQFDENNNPLFKKAVDFRSLGLDEDSEEYWLKVPMEVQDENGNSLEGVFIHDADWYNTLNVAERDSENTIKEGKKNVNDLRLDFMKSGRRSYDITITGRTNGFYEAIPYNDVYDLPTISENNPDVILGFVTKGEVKDVRHGNFQTIPNSQIIGINEKMQAGSPVMLSLIAPDKYLAIYPVSDSYGKMKGTETNRMIVNSARKAMAAYLLTNGSDSLAAIASVMNRDEANSVVKSFIDDYGLDISNFKNIERYLSMIFNINFGQVDEDYVRSKVPGSIVAYFEKGQLTLVKNLSDSAGNLIRYTKEDPTNLLRNLVYLYPNVANFASSDTYAQTFPIINDENKVVTYKSPTTGRSSYSDLLKDIYRTSLKSWNVGTEQNPMYVSAVQPVITFSKKGTASEKSVAEIPMEEQISEQVVEATLPVVIHTNIEERTQNAINSAIKMLQELGLRTKDEFSTPSRLSNESVNRLIDSIRTIPLSIPEIRDVKNSMVATIFSNLNNKYGDKFSEEEFEQEFNIKFDKYYQSTVDLLKSSLTELEEINNIQENKSISLLLEEVKSHIDKFRILQENWEGLLKDAKLIVTKFVKFKETEADNQQSEELIDDIEPTFDTVDLATGDSDNDEMANNDPDNPVFDLQAFQENYKNSASLLVKRSLFTIPEYTIDGEKIRGAFGMFNYKKFDGNYNILMNLIAGSKKFMPNTDELIDYLNSDAIPLLYRYFTKEVAILIKNNDQLAKAISYALTKSNVSLKQVVEQTNKSQTAMKVWDVNANEALRGITTQWRESNKVSDLVERKDDGHFIVDDVRKDLISTFNEWLKNKDKLLKIEIKENDKGEQYKNVTFVDEGLVTSVQNWLNHIGIKMDANAIHDIFRYGYTIFEEGKLQGTRLVGTDLLTHSQGVFQVLNQFFNNIPKNTKSTPDILENQSINVFDTESAMILRLAKVAQKYMGFVPAPNFRDGGKSLYGFENFMLDKLIVQKIKDDPDYREKMSKTIFEGDSYVLKAIMSNAKIASEFDLITSAINAIKIYGKDNYGNFEVKDLSDADLERLGAALFTNQSDNIAYDNGYGIPMRMASILGLTSSDKKRRNIMNIPVLNLSTSHINVSEGIISDSKEALKLKNFLFDNFILPELKRIISHLKNSKGNPNKSVNQKDYNFGAQLFLTSPFLNSVKIDDDGKQNIIEYLLNAPNEVLNDSSTIIEKFRENATSAIVAHINEESKNKFAKWVELLSDSPETDAFGKAKNNQKVFSLYTDNGIVEYTGISHFDDKYLNKFSEKKSEFNSRVKGLSVEYTINTMLSNMNNHQMFLGDIAHYSQNKLFAIKKGQNKYFEVLTSKDEDGNSKETIRLDMPKYPGAYNDVVKEIGINLGKRAAMLIAPGGILNNSKGEEYIQLYANDANRVSEDVLDLIRIFYGDEKYEQTKEPYAKFRNNLKELSKLQQRNSLSEAEVREIFNPLKAEIENQIKKWSSEFSKIAGYFDIESTDAQEYTTWQEHLRILEGQGNIDKRTAEKLAKQIQSHSLKLEDLHIIFQPIKPVFAGKIHEAIPNTNQYRVRQVYVKSSSFPLIPQLTIGTQLNGLREKMEEIQSKSNKKVRLSYGTANKVGAVSQPIQLWDANGNFFGQNFDVDRIIKETESGISTQALKLPREYFKIQQNVPFKSEKNNYDKNTLGTQLMKLAFSNGIKDLLFEKYGNNDVFDSYNNAFANWEKDIYTNLLDELGLDKDGNAIDSIFTLNKMRKMLEKEAKSRNFPQQDIDILSGLVNDTEFEIPLWLSANSYRYEAFINSILNNRFSKLKLPGASFVVGSEEGFLSPEEVVSTNRMVYTSKFKGRLTANQALVPSKFRDNNGKMIDLTSNEWSTVDASGRRMLREDKVDAELLNLISFRIPSSGHGSISQAEIAGFLPYETGDLAIYGKDMTKQKGLDFDVDKENTYWFYHQIDENGRIVKVTKENYKGDDNTKIYQNDIIEAYHKIYGAKDLSNPIDVQIQRKIRGILNTDFAEEQAQIIRDIFNTTSDSKNFSILSEEYQNNKMKLGAVGKMGIGVYANGLTLHALIQQMSQPLSLLSEDEIVIGNYSFRGVFGQEKTLDGDRDIAEAFNEKANTATDNEKLQILGAVGVNSFTIGVDSLMTLMGFDKDTIVDKEGNTIKISIPYFLLSQPIIRDYVDAMKTSNSQIADFDFNKKQTITDKLIAKYGGTEIADNLKDYKKITGQNLYNNLTNPDNTFNDFQQLVLAKFLSLAEVAEKMQQIQSSLNIQKSGLGKSFWEAESKTTNLNSLLTPGYFRGNDFEFVNTESLISNENGLTPMGSIHINLINSYERIFKKFFPYVSDTFQITVNDIVDSIGGQDMSNNKKIKLQYEVTEELKKYVLANINGMYDVSKLQEERYRLFFDDKDSKKQSLAKYIFDMKYSTDPKIANIVRSNALLSQFDFSLNTGTDPSTIIYRNTKGEDILEDYKYQAIIELLGSDIQLPYFNGAKYSTNEFVSDLVSYSYMSGGLQGATDFIKYIPLSVIREFGISDNLRDFNQNLMNDEVEDFFNGFEQQFFQHNPTRAFKVSPTQIISLSGKAFDDKTQQIAFKPSTEPEDMPSYISVYNKDKKGKGIKKYQLYKLRRISEERYSYDRIPTLGVNGLSEYIASSLPVQPLIDRDVDYVGDVNYKPKAFTETKITKQLTNLFDIRSNNLANVIENITISKSVSTGIKQLTESLKKYINSDMHITYDYLNGSDGIFDSKTNTITIGIDHVNSSTPEVVASTIIKELMHAVTVPELRRFYRLKDNGEYQIENDAPKHIRDLNQLFSKVRKQVQENKSAAYNSMVSKRAMSLGLDSNDELIAYGVKDIYEFVSEIFGNPDFQQYLNGIEYPLGGTYLQRFISIITNLLESIGLSFKQGTALSEGMNSVFSLLEEKGKPFEVATPKVESTNEQISLFNKILNIDPSVQNRDNVDDDEKSTPTFNQFSTEELEYLESHGVTEAQFNTLTLSEKKHFLSQLKEKC